MNEVDRLLHAKMLDVACDASAAEARAAFLRKLWNEGYAPAEEVVAAVRALASADLPQTRDAIADAATRLIPELEEFEASYWSLEPGERRSRWADLVSRCREARLANRLRQLEAGLDVAPEPHANPLAGEIAVFIRVSFLLPDRERSVRRARWLAGQAERYERLGAAACGLRETDAPTAALDPLLIDRLIRGRCPKPIAAITVWQDRKTWYRVAGSVVFSLFIVFAAARDDRKPRVKKPEIPIWSPPPAVFSNDDVFIFEAYEKRRTSGQYAPKPSRYDLWVESGRPGRRWIPSTNAPRPGAPEGKR